MLKRILNLLVAQLRYQAKPLNASLVAGVLLLCVPVSQASNQQQLLNVQQQLKQQQEQAEQHQKQLNKAQKNLRSYELALADSSRDLRRLGTQERQLTQQVDSLSLEQQNLQQQISQQQQILAEHLRNAYKNGSQDYLKLLLKQQDSQQLARLLKYYQSLSVARAEAIAILNEQRLALSQSQIELKQQQQKLADLVAQQQVQHQQHQHQQTKREQQRNQLNQLLKSEQSQIAKLQQQENDLQHIVSEEIEAQQQENARQQRQQNTAPLSGFAKQKGQLSWPLQGRVLHSYNSANQGQHRWQGMVIDSHPGTAIQAIAAGDVVYADWLRGYGLVIALDHGDDYLSLYGYNQSLAREVGERVNAGDNIAHAGNTGGQSTNALFFQIRHRGETQDPKPWLK